MGYARVVDLHEMAGHPPSFDEIRQAPDHASAIRALWVMVFLVAIKDRASELRFEPERGEDCLRYRIGEELYPLAPPPMYHSPRLIRELYRLIRPNNLSSRLARLFNPRNPHGGRRPFERIVFLLTVQDALVGGAATISRSPQSPSIVVALFSDEVASRRASESLRLCIDELNYPSHESELGAPTI